LQAAILVCSFRFNDPHATMPIFSRYYNTGLLCGIAAASGISIWWYNRESIYLRVKSDLEKEKGPAKH
jgi:hypothetical protein